jgi:hypothetical protein
MTLTANLFELGSVSVSPEAEKALRESGESIKLYLDRHVAGDWGELSDSEMAANTLALVIGGELISCYPHSSGTKLWVLTEANQTRTHLYLYTKPREEDVMKKLGVNPDMVFGSFTSAVGLALGEVLLLADRPERLGTCLASIEATAYATLLSVGRYGGPRGRSLSSAALGVVQAWHEERELADALQVLEEALEAMGVRFVPDSFDGEVYMEP